MNSKIKKGRIEFNNENYENALRYFECVSHDDEDYMYVVMFKITCLMELEQFDKALFLIESLLKEDPEDEFLLYEKIRCHISLNECDEALNALKVFEKFISSDNKRMVLAVAKFYKALGDFNNALKFCNYALEIDENFEEAIFEKSLVAIDLNDREIINSCADKLLEIVDGNIQRISVFLLKLYVGNFEDCLKIVDGFGNDFDEDDIKMLKSVIYKEFSESLGVNIHLTEDIEVPVDEAISLLSDYRESGVNVGVINGVAFRIM